MFQVKSKLPKSSGVDLQIKVHFLVYIRRSIFNGQIVKPCDLRMPGLIPLTLDLLNAYAPLIFNEEKYTHVNSNSDLK